MNRDYKLLKRRVTLRIILGELLLFLVVLIITPVLIDAAKTLLDGAYRTTNSQLWYELFWFFSAWRYFILAIIFFFLNIICFRWAIRIVFNHFNLLRNQIIHLPEENTEPIQFPAELKQVEEDIAHAKSEYKLRAFEAKEASSRKDDLVVSLAHDIRTPLTSVLGYLELLNESPELTEQQIKRFSDIALRKARRLERLVDELFEITRFNVSKITLEKQTVNVNILINQLKEELMPVLTDRNLDCRVINDGLTSLFADPVQFARVMDNLLHNAAYYTEENGHITIRLGRTEDQRARIEVINTGVEIPPEKLTHIFEKFYRGDTARQSATGGSGLGLAIAKQIIEAHGGVIFASSEDHITTFTIIL